MMRLTAVGEEKDVQGEQHQRRAPSIRTSQHHRGRPRDAEVEGHSPAVKRGYSSSQPLRRRISCTSWLVSTPCSFWPCSSEACGWQEGRGGLGWQEVRGQAEVDMQQGGLRGREGEAGVAESQ